MFSHSQPCSSFDKARASFRTHCLPDGSLSRGLQVYLMLLKGADQPTNTSEIQMFANNVVEQVQSDYSRPGQWPAIVRFMHKTNRPEVNRALERYRAKLWTSLSREDRTEGERMMEEYAADE